MNDSLYQAGAVARPELVPGAHAYTKKLAIVIPTYNRNGTTQACISSLSLKNDPCIKIFICDSNSTDGTRDAFVGQLGVEVINVGNDCWWTGAVNRGIAIALTEGYEFVLVLNDDIDIPPHLIDSMLEKARLNPGKIISPAQRTGQGIFLGMNYSGPFKLPNVIWAGGEHVQVDVETSNGCCLLIPMVTFQIIGLFDETHCPHLYGDTEFQTRAWNYGLGTKAFSDIAISQHENTDYFRKLSFWSLLTHKGSPVHLLAYVTFGRSLFQGWHKFIFLGLYHHHLFLRSLLKAVYVLLRQGINSMQRMKC